MILLNFEHFFKLKKSILQYTVNDLQIIANFLFQVERLLDTANLSVALLDLPLEVTVF